MHSALLSVEQAQQRLLEHLNPIATTEVCPLHDAHGRVLSQPVISHIAVPSADLSMMDGYAMHHESFAVGQSYPISQRITAGQTQVAPLEKGTIARIFTGAMLPEGATCVVMQEDTQRDEDDQIIITTPPQAHQHVRRYGSEIMPHQTLLTPGTRLTPAAIGLCASVGQPSVACYHPLTIALLTTGNELVEIGQPIAAGQTYNSNQLLLQALLASHGFQVSLLGIVPDQLDQTIEYLSSASKYDAIITTGGVSVGEEDHVREAVAQLGQIDAWKIRMKPGKPFAFGQVNNTPFFGLPGNPVAAFTTFHLFVLPALQKLQGITPSPIIPETVIANFEHQAGDRREYVRARIQRQSGQAIADIYPNQQSSVLASAVWAEGFIPIESHQHVAVGDRVNFISFHQYQS